MTRRLAALAAALLISTGLGLGPARAQSEADGAAMQATISAQLEAFQHDDWAKAFTYASPTIQGMFVTPENFGAMVRNGYPMVWRPGAVKFLGAQPSPEGPRQVLLITDQSGRQWVADYLMRKVDGVWRIAGVTLRPQVEAGA